jgi:hypothetical protein
LFSRATTWRESVFVEDVLHGDGSGYDLIK